MRVLSLSQLKISHSMPTLYPVPNLNSRRIYIFPLCAIRNQARVSKCLVRPSNYASGRRGGVGFLGDCRGVAGEQDKKGSAGS